MCFKIDKHEACDNIKIQEVQSVKQEFKPIKSVAVTLINENRISTSRLVGNCRQGPRVYIKEAKFAIDSNPITFQKTRTTMLQETSGQQVLETLKNYLSFLLINQ